MSSWHWQESLLYMIALPCLVHDSTARRSSVLHDAKKCGIILVINQIFCGSFLGEVGLGTISDSPSNQDVWTVQRKLHCRCSQLELVLLLAEIIGRLCLWSVSTSTNLSGRQAHTWVSGELHNASLGLETRFSIWQCCGSSSRCQFSDSWMKTYNCDPLVLGPALAIDKMPYRGKILSHLQNYVNRQFQLGSSNWN